MHTLTSKRPYWMFSEGVEVLTDSTKYLLAVLIIHALRTGSSMNCQSLERACLTDSVPKTAFTQQVDGPTGQRAPTMSCSEHVGSGQNAGLLLNSKLAMAQFFFFSYKYI